jgi:DNA invertase Pin-like site-specific DNA recombinase
VLVYDVSRWGRFQDVDESAYYEYICKRANVSIHYCAEQFENDGSLSSSLLKTIKRTMAGEYSRELSVKVFAGQCRLIERGFRQGGPAGYGLRRQNKSTDSRLKSWNKSKCSRNKKCRPKCSRTASAGNLFAPDPIEGIWGVSFPHFLDDGLQKEWKT